MIGYGSLIYDLSYGKLLLRDLVKHLEVVQKIKDLLYSRILVCIQLAHHSSLRPSTIIQLTVSYLDLFSLPPLDTSLKYSEPIFPVPSTLEVTIVDQILQPIAAFSQKFDISNRRSLSI